MKIDLHIHTIYSDGSFSPSEIIDICHKDQITAISITDHDNINALSIAQKAAEAKGIEFIPGVEINTVWNNKEFHILGYYMNPEHKYFKEIIQKQKQAREDQIKEIVHRLKTIAKIDISYEDIIAQSFPDGCIGRPHIARTLFMKGATKTIQEAYTRYINVSVPTYIERKTVTPHEAVEAIYEAGGIPVLAHPKETEKIEETVKDLMNYGLRGIEAYHKSHSPALVEYHSCLAEKLGLIVTGGSDCHGNRFNSNYIMGKTFIPTWVLKELKKEKARLEKAFYQAN